MKVLTVLATILGLFPAMQASAHARAEAERAKAVCDERILDTMVYNEGIASGLTQEEAIARAYRTTIQYRIYQQMAYDSQTYDEALASILSQYEGYNEYCQRYR